MKISAFRIAESLDDALNALRELGPAALPLAGATSLAFLPETQPYTAIDINRIGLSGIRRENGRFVIGATTRVAELQHFSQPGWVLDRVAKCLASQPIRNQSTLGGNICRVFPWADFPVALLVLDATVVLRDAEAREMAAKDFFSQQPARLFREPRLLTEVRVPALGPQMGFGYRKLRLTSTAFSMVTVAAWLEREGNAIRSVRLALGAGVPFPTLVEGVGARLAGLTASPEVLRQAVEPEFATLRFVGAEGMSADYIAHAACVAAADALMEAWQQSLEQTP